eukprot:NODE_15032_length_1072_cov_2.757672.p1 GENE.NODE_15032_length_1072_cov_2.757672~~NODE_15032_length_1072_cov_2.757672.p1  ORF type:complete len:344 (+),score=40.62 NODE_15032_length_1072_cov_2.757672:98-1033(+)
MMAFVPFGSFISTLAPMPVVILDPSKTFLAIAGCLLLPILIHQIVGNFIEPFFFADSMNLHPITIMLALTFWATVWGVLGALMCVPLTAMVRVVLKGAEMHHYIRPAIAILEGSLTGFERGMPNHTSGPLHPPPPSPEAILAARRGHNGSGASAGNGCRDRRASSPVAARSTKPSPRPQPHLSDATTQSQATSSGAGSLAAASGAASPAAASATRSGAGGPAAASATGSRVASLAAASGAASPAAASATGSGAGSPAAASATGSGVASLAAASGAASPAAASATGSGAGGPATGSGVASLAAASATPDPSL